MVCGCIVLFWVGWICVGFSSFRFNCEFSVLVGRLRCNSCFLLLGFCVERVLICCKIGWISCGSLFQCLVECCDMCVLIMICVMFRLLVMWVWFGYNLFFIVISIEGLIWCRNWFMVCGMFKGVSVVLQFSLWVRVCLVRLLVVMVRGNLVVSVLVRIWVEVSFFMLVVCSQMLLGIMLGLVNVSCFC